MAVGARVGRLVSSDSIPAGGFTPGRILADRYRIIGLLGRGGMGEVYRADDLKLGQAVALKFLPRALADDPVRRERFFAEVRITRQVSHPNICRVYDIAEVEGHHFLSMEYIDGEDLASLIKRIGYLPNEKALDVARQLAAGLSAAHERGVLHRDLKPANVMVDGHGRVRITDFGLAIASDDEQAGDTSGTPAYMAPEQLAGKGATVRSDIYAFGLILYEIGPAFFLSRLLGDIGAAGIFIPLSFLFLLFLLRVLLRSTWIAAAVWIVAITPQFFDPSASWMAVPLGVLEGLVFLFVLLRLGLFAMMVTGFVLQVLLDFPLSLQTSAWYSGYGYTALLIIGVIALYGFRGSLGGQRLFELAEA
ncbi:MAG TPA: serine/threonine-protein kinase [Vicinamibacterales bacterium]|nr:serine/threonine-protein kinase [Vicinamibacterales bacterium]